MKQKNLERRLQTIAKHMGSFVVFRIGVDKEGNIGILGLDNEGFVNNDEEMEDIIFPIINPQIDAKKPLQYLEYIG